ncbi:Fatty acid amide hydrolase [Bertholletia excelsa]
MLLMMVLCSFDFRSTCGGAPGPLSWLSDSRLFDSAVLESISVLDGIFMAIKDDINCYPNLSKEQAAQPELIELEKTLKAAMTPAGTAREIISNLNKKGCWWKELCPNNKI